MLPRFGDDLRFIQCTHPTRHMCPKEVTRAHQDGKAAIVFHCSLRITECVSITILLPRGLMKFSRAGRYAAGLLHDVYQLSGWMHASAITDASMHGIMFDGIQVKYLDNFIQDLIKFLGNTDGDYILQRNSGADHP